MSDKHSASAENEYCAENIQVMPIPQSFYGWLDAIRERPYRLRKKTLECLRSWLDGYESAKLEAGTPRSEEEKEFEGFDYFVCQRYERYDNVGWSAKIAYYNWDDAEALAEFFKLLDAFRLSKRQAPDDSIPKGR